MATYRLNSNRERKAYWEELSLRYTEDEVQKALASLEPTTRKVLLLYYAESYSFKEICTMIQRSISIVRNHHNRGFFQLYRYFNAHLKGDEPPVWESDDNS